MRYFAVAKSVIVCGFLALDFFLLVVTAIFRAATIDASSVLLYC